jgi:hypothetical protein
MYRAYNMNGGHKNCVENKQKIHVQLSYLGTVLTDFEVSVCSISHKPLGTLLGTSSSSVAGLEF